MYNKASSERKWRKWKDEEDKLLAQLGVHDKVIQELHDYDWETFKEQRRYYEKQISNCDILDYIKSTDNKMDTNNIYDLLNQIDDEKIYTAFINLSSLSLNIIFLKFCGYSNKEIAILLKISDRTVRRHLDKLKKSLKNIY